MPSERPEAWSDWGTVERIAGAPMPAIPSQVAFVMGAAKAAVVSRILSMASSGRARFGSSAIENTRLPPPSSAASARNATADFVSSTALVSAACATSATDLWLDSSAEADWTASSTSRWPTAAPMAGPTTSRSLPPSLAMRLTGVYFRVPDARESSSKYSRVFPRPAAFIKRRGARTGCFSGAPCDKGRKVGWLEVAMEVLADSHQGYSSESRSFLVARRAFGLVNGSTSQILVRPFVVLAARVLGPGPTRLRLVKLAHTLDRDARFVVPEKGGAHGEDRPSVTPTSRAA